MGQMKFTKLHISSRQPNRETYTGGFVVPLAGLRIKRDYRWITYYDIIKENIAG